MRGTSKDASVAYVFSFDALVTENAITLLDAKATESGFRAR
jgi:hypothetical protein